ncbi:hypothetical protein Pat9b_4496 (plasmid) [Pantoea sp. At-9b]|nr:hypothetical protein Pat9b_4496 [Pantoea sp. At-9b]
MSCSLLVDKNIVIKITIFFEKTAFRRIHWDNWRAGIGMYVSVWQQLCHVQKRHLPDNN